MFILFLYILILFVKYRELITCDAPISSFCYRLVLNQVDFENGKKCTTLFKRISTNGISSIVECHPITGRTHQIRVHLQYLGILLLPIVILLLIVLYQMILFLYLFYKRFSD